MKKVINTIFQEIEGSSNIKHNFVDFPILYALQGAIAALLDISLRTVPINANRKKKVFQKRSNEPWWYEKYSTGIKSHQAPKEDTFRKGLASVTATNHYITFMSLLLIVIFHAI